MSVDQKHGSKFSYEQCHDYAKHLRATGQGITNPGGYATAIRKSGEMDIFIEAWLSGGTEARASPAKSWKRLLQEAIREVMTCPMERLEELLGFKPAEGETNALGDFLDSPDLSGKEAAGEKLRRLGASEQMVEWLMKKLE